MAEFKIAVPEVDLSQVDTGVMGGTAETTPSTGGILPADFKLQTDPNAGMSEFSPSSKMTVGDIPPAVDTDQIESGAGDLTLPEETEHERFDTGVFTQVATEPAVQEAPEKSDEQIALEKEREGLRGDIERGFEDLEGMGAFQEGVEDAAGLQAKREALTAINNQVRKAERDFDLEIRDIKDTTLTRAQKNARINERTDKANRRLADLAIRQMAIQGQFNDALALVNRKVELEMQSRKTQLDKLMFFYGENKDRFSTVEQREFEKRIRDEQRAYDTEKEDKSRFEEFKYGVLSNAVEMGAGMAVYDQIQSTESMEELLATRGLTSYVRGPQTGSVSAPTIKNINGVDMQWDPTTGSWVELPGAGTSDYSVERASRTRQSVAELLADAIASPGIFGRTAAAPLPDFMRTDAFRNFKGELDTLKSNIAFNELTAMREASKTGGALGQVSDREGRLLQSALGALEMDQSAKNFQEQLRKIDASIGRWQEAVAKHGGVVNQNITLTAPDGTQVEIID